MASRNAWLAAAGLQLAGLGLLAGPLMLPASALAAPRNAVSAPRITAFDVKAVDRVEPGTDLVFTLWGSAGGQASLRIDGAQRPLQLAETSAGVYEGVYTVSRRDKIAPGASVNANLRSGNRVDTAVLDEPLQLDYKPAAAPASGPEISRFDVRTENTRNGGSTLHFMLNGTPQARASVHVPGAQARMLLLDETRPGQYEGQYALQAGDTLDTGRPARARLRLGEHVVTADAQSNLQQVPSRVVAAPVCLDCGKVTAVNRIELNGDGSLVGTAAGGVLGAVVGSQIGQGNGRNIAGLAGAIGGALLGREIERRTTKKVHYEVVTRLDNGGQRTASFDSPPAFRVGDVVRWVNGALQAADRR